MTDLFSYLIIVHIAGGTAGLISGSIAASVKKGGKVHLLSGKLFFYGMLAASISALVISWLPNHHNLFLFAVGGFTFYMTVTGYRIVFLKRMVKHNPQPISWIDYSIALFNLVFSGFLLVLAVMAALKGNMFALVPAVFGLVCLNFLRMDYALLTGKKQIRDVWMSNHISRMMGAMIASYTAFLVVNVQIQQQWILWLLPGVLGGILISRFTRKYAPVKKQST